MTSQAYYRALLTEMSFSEVLEEYLYHRPGASEIEYDAKLIAIRDQLDAIIANIQSREPR